MRRMRIVSALVVTVMLGSAVIPVYGAEAGTVVELAEEDTSTEATEEDTEGASAEATEESLTEENLPNVDESTEDVSTDMEAVVSEEDFTETEVATNRKEVQAFIERMYTKALGREADSAGVEYWTNVLIKKEKTAAEVGYNFVFSHEYKNKNTKDDAFVEMLYNVFMDRKSDKEGKNYWVGLLEKGYSRRYVYRKFAHSEEYTKVCQSYKITRGVITLESERDLYPNLTEYVGRLYSKALDRRCTAGADLQSHQYDGQHAGL